MRSTTDIKAHEMETKAEDFQNLISRLTILSGKEGSLSLAIKAQIKEENYSDDLVNKIDDSILGIISNYNNLGINQSGISELDLGEANEICANATKLLDEFISFLKKEDFLLSNNLLISLENEKNIYNQMHHIVYSLIAPETTNENLSQTNEIPITKSNPDNIETAQYINDTDLKTLSEDPFLKEELEIYDLDAELIDTTQWAKAVTEIHQLIGDKQSTANTYDLDDLLENIQQDSKVLDSKNLHATVSNDIKEAKSSIRAELEEKYKNILNITIQLNKTGINDALAHNLLESKKIISQMYNSLSSLGDDDSEMVKLDEDKFQFSNELSKLLHEQIISNQYKQFIDDYENLSKSYFISDKERLSISTIHGKLVSNIEEYIVDWGSNDNIHKIWDSSDSNMKEINQIHQKQALAQWYEKLALKEAALKDVDLNALLAKAQDAISHNDHTALIDMKKQLIDQQKYLSKSLEKAINSIDTIKLLKDTINSVSECLKKINNELGITTPTILAQPINKEKDLGNQLPSLPSARRTR